VGRGGLIEPFSLGAILLAVVGIGTLLFVGEWWDDYREHARTATAETWDRYNRLKKYKRRHRKYIYAIALVAIIGLLFVTGVIWVEVPK